MKPPRRVFLRVLRLTKYWLIGLLAGVAYHCAEVYDRHNPPPSQAVVDDTYRHNNDDLLISVDTVNAVLSALVQGGDKKGSK